MDKVKILIVEDDMIVAADISMQLTLLGYEVTGILPRGEDVKAHIQGTPPDMVLMDIQLKGSMDGIATSQMIYDEFKIPVIFLTANADNASFQRAKQTRPYAFISKPFENLDLTRAIELVISRLAIEQEDKILLTQENSVPEGTPYLLDDRIFVRYNNRMVKVFLSDIQFVVAERSYCKINTATKEFLMTASLKQFIEKLTLPQFMRVHRSYLINLTKVDEISEGYEFVRIGKNNIPVSRSHREELARRLQLL